MIGVTARLRAPRAALLVAGVLASACSTTAASRQSTLQQRTGRESVSAAELRMRVYETADRLGGTLETRRTISGRHPPIRPCGAAPFSGRRTAYWRSMRRPFGPIRSRAAWISGCWSCRWISTSSREPEGGVRGGAADRDSRSQADANFRRADSGPRLARPRTARPHAREGRGIRSRPSDRGQLCRSGDCDRRREVLRPGEPRRIRGRRTGGGHARGPVAAPREATPRSCPRKYAGRESCSPGKSPEGRISA